MPIEGLGLGLVCGDRGHVGISVPESRLLEHEDWAVVLSSHLETRTSA